MSAVLASNLYYWVNERRLCNTFSTFGHIEDVDIINCGLDGKKGIIYFSQRESAAEAVRRLNGAHTEIGNPLVLQIDWLKGKPGKQEGMQPLVGGRKSNLNSETDGCDQTLVFVKNFKDMLNEDSLASIFKVFGNVKSVSIKKENGQSKGYGYVDFESHAAAVEAVNTMNNEEIEGGRKLHVAFVRRKQDREMICYESNKSQNVVLYVRNLPKNTTGQILRELFEKYGSIASVSVKTTDDADTAVGFVSFEDGEEAQKALMYMSGYVMDSRALSIVIKAERRPRQMNNKPSDKSKIQNCPDSAISPLFSFNAIHRD